MKIAICTPVHGDTRAAFTACYAKLIAYSIRQGIEIETFMTSTSHVPDGRSRLTKMALDWGADAILWIDSDQTFPSDALERLLKHNLDIVGCNYARRTLPSSQLASVESTAFKAMTYVVEEAAYMGLGFCLTSAKALNAVPEPKFAYAINEAGEHVSEDIVFFEKARAYGLKVYVDHEVSWQIGHIVQQNLYLRDIPNTHRS